MNTVAEQPKSGGRISRSWQILKSSWRVLNLDKELSVFPFISFLVGMFAFMVGFVIILLNLVETGQSTSFSTSNLSAGEIAALIAVGIFTSLIGVYTTAALVAAALIRFRGGDPRIRDGLSAVKKRFGSLTIYGLFYLLVGQVLSFIEERVPFLGGKIVAILAHIAWTVANIFSIPVIVESKTPVMPIKALKGSVGIIKKAWAESVVSNVSIALFFVILIVLEAVAGIGGAMLANAAGAPNGIIATIVGFTVLLAQITIIIASALSGIIKAALYHYATTGEAPAHFDKHLMQQAFTKRKARKIFS